MLFYMVWVKMSITFFGFFQISFKER
jgi:hypothetical protein